MRLFEWFEAKKINQELEKFLKGEKSQLLPEEKDVFLFLKDLSSLKEETPKINPFLNLETLPERKRISVCLFSWQVRVAGLIALILFSLFMPKILFFHSSEFIGLNKEAIAQEIATINKDINLEEEERIDHLLEKVIPNRKEKIKGLSYEDIQKEIKKINQDKKKNNCRQIKQILEIIKTK